jgi:hypothetical protein
MVRATSFFARAALARDEDESADRRDADDPPQDILRIGPERPMML